MASVHPLRSSDRAVKSVHGDTANPRRVAMLSAHTSPLDQPGTGDAGGMNVYVVETARRLAEAGTEVEIFPRERRRLFRQLLSWPQGYSSDTSRQVHSRD